MPRTPGPDAAPADLAKRLRRQIAAALAALRGKAPLSDDTVHEARKQLKRARASLRLLRGAIGESEYARENARLRDAARPLARVRDAKVLLAAVERLLEDEKKARRRAALVRLRRALADDRLGLRGQLQDSGDLEEVERSLVAARRAVGQWRLAGRSAARDGVRRIYRKGRKALAAAESDPSDEHLHESRKQVKYLGNAIELLGAERSPGLAKLMERVRRVDDELGDDHDLALLESRIATLPADDPAETLLSRIESRRRKLQKKALRQARGLYRRKAGAFVERLPL